ncbi:MAG: hypothetical protein Q8R60_01200 [Mycobacteriales bacterium]|nr:hypothetical protein [Mycobacteriales bacterium]
MSRLRPAVALAGLVVVAAVLPAVPQLLRPGLPGLTDATGLSGAGLLAGDADPPQVVRLAVGGAQRAYLYAPARRVPRLGDPGLLVVLPAANRTVQQTYSQLGLDAFRDHGLAVAVASALEGWNAGTCCGEAARDGVDDVAALRVVTDDAARRAGADRDRVALLGYSTGGFMVYRLLCEGSLDVRAAVEVAGSLATSCRERRDVPPTLAVHGSDDDTVPLGPSDEVVPVLGVVPLSVREAVSRLSTAAGCAPDPDDCPVRLDEVADAGHRWEDLQPTGRIAAFLADAVPGVR